MTTIKNFDLKDKGLNAKLVGHLKSDDFFGVEKFPTSKFSITKSEKFVNGKAKITGNLTIKNNTEEISFYVTKKDGVYTTRIEVDRSKFDIKYGSNSFFDGLGDMAISDIFILDISIVL